MPNLCIQSAYIIVSFSVERFSLRKNKEPKQLSWGAISKDWLSRRVESKKRVKTGLFLKRLLES